MNARFILMLVFVAVGGANIAKGMECDTVVDALTSHGNFSVLVTAIENAGLEDVMMTETSRFTILAPVDSAFDHTLAETGLTADLLLGSTNLLGSILKTHVLTEVVQDPRKYIGQSVPAVEKDTSITFASCPAPMSSDSICVYTTPDLPVMILDPTGIEACQSVVYAINGILLPDGAEAGIAGLLDSAAEDVTAISG